MLTQPSLSFCGMTPSGPSRCGTLGHGFTAAHSEPDPAKEPTGEARVVDQSMLEVDSRRRISLGSLAIHDRYLVAVEDDGTIILTPAVVMSVAEARLHAATETVRRVDEFLDNPELGSRRTRPLRQE